MHMGWICSQPLPPGEGGAGFPVFFMAPPDQEGAGFCNI